MNIKINLISKTVRSFLFLSCLFAPSLVEARDIRLALLVGHSHGWKKRDPTLRYAISGDLLPLASILKKIGFQVRVLKNPTEFKLRTVFESISQRVKKTPKVTTFLFYYTGHADKDYLHLGQEKGHSPFSYKEFGRTFSRIRTIRKIAIFDSCQSGQIIRKFGSLRNYRLLLKKGLPKGVRRIRAIDIIKLRILDQGDEKGIRIISSSEGDSWDSGLRFLSVMQ